MGLAVSLAFIALFFLIVDIEEMGEALANARYQYVAPAVLLYFVALLLRSLRWQYLLSPLRRFPPSRLFHVVTVGYMANNLLPARLGEVARAYYLGRRENFSGSRALATIVVERVYDGLTLLSLAAVAVPFLLLAGLVDHSGSTARWTWILVGALAALAFIAAITVLTLLAINPKLGRFIEGLANLLPARIRPKARELIALFIEGLSILRQPRRHLGLFLWSLPVWLLEGAMYLIVAFSFDLQELFSPGILLVPVILFVMAASNLATSLPSSPGSIGTFEVPAAAALTLVGVSDGVAGAYAFMLHVSLLLPVTAVGLLFLWLSNVSLRRLVRGEGVSPMYPVAHRGGDEQ